MRKEKEEVRRLELTSIGVGEVWDEVGNAGDDGYQYHIDYGYDPSAKKNSLADTIPFHFNDPTGQIVIEEGKVRNENTGGGTKETKKKVRMEGYLWMASRSKPSAGATSLVTTFAFTMQSHSIAE